MSRRERDRKKKIPSRLVDSLTQASKKERSLLAIFIVTFRQKVSACNFATSLCISRRVFAIVNSATIVNNETVSELVALIENCAIISRTVAESFSRRLSILSVLHRRIVHPFVIRRTFGNATRNSATWLFSFA